jgi:hypothetical protein
LRLIVGQQPPLFALGLGDERAETIHRDFAAVGADDAERALRVPGAAHLNGLGEFLVLLGSEPLERIDTGQLLGAGRLASQRLEGLRQRRPRRRVRLEIAFFAGQEIAALACFRVLGVRLQRLQLFDHLQRMRHPLHRFLTCLEGAKGEQADQGDRQDRDDESRERCGGQHRNGSSRAMRITNDGRLGHGIQGLGPTMVHRTPLSSD